MRMLANFKFHPIGQGCFYTGRLGLHSKRPPSFNFVYDCGTKSKKHFLIDAIDTYKAEIESKQLDMLFISHLDADHVNGVKELLTGIGCKTIYLPYLTPIQRLFVALSTNPNDFDSPEDYRDFLRFLISPHNYLIGIDNAPIDKIVYIFGNSEDELIISNPSDTPINPDEINFDKFVIEDNLVPIDEQEYSSEMKEIKGKDKNDKIAFKKGNNTLILNRIWEFYLYCNSDKNKVLVEGLITKLNKVFGVSITENTLNLESILTNQAMLQKLTDSYLNILKNLNKTGLIVQHKPLGYIRFKSSNVDNSRNLHYWHRGFFRPNLSRYNLGVTLLTGDIRLDQIHESNYIERHLEYVLIFQVPHHGSRTGWDTIYLNHLNNDGRTTAIINFGFPNSFKHPNPNVVFDLIANNFIVRFCTQYKDYNYSFELDF